MYIQPLSLPPPPPTYQPFRQEDDISVIELFGVVAENRWLIAAVTASALLLGGAYAFLSTPVYEANTLIQVEESKGKSAAPTSALGAATSLFEIQSPATAEMEILRSRLIVGQVVKNLQLDLSVEPKYIPVIGGFLARQASTPSNPGIFGLNGYVSGTESLKVASFDVPAKFEGKRFTVRLSSNGYDLLSPDGETLATGVFGSVLAFAVGGQRGQVLISAAVGKPGAEFYLRRFPRLKVMEDLQRNLVINEQGRQSGVILTSLTGSEPVRIASILNEIGSLYVRQNASRKVAEAEKTLGFLNTNIPQLRAKIEQSESKFNQFRNQNRTFDLGTESKLVMEQSVKLQTSLLELQQKRRELEARFMPEHSSIKTIDAQIKRINSEMGATTTRVKAFPNIEQDLLRLTRDMKVDTELYSSLLNSAQQHQLVMEGKVGNVRIVDAAVVPETPVKPQRQTVLALAAALGLIASLTLVFFRNGMRRGIRHPTDIEQRVGLQVFSTIPFSKVQARPLRAIGGRSSDRSILATQSPDEPAIENLRSLRTALQFAMLDVATPTVMVTGPTSGSGKSFISANFATVMGAANKRVLLIDADMRKGHLNQYFGLGRGSGLSDVVTGNAKLENALHRQIAPNVDFLSAGAVPPNPAELLLTGAVQQLLQHAAKHYDLVIVCCAPVLRASDAAILAPMVGAVFLVARAEVTSLSDLQESDKRLSQNGAQAKGVIFNGVDLSKHHYGTGQTASPYRYVNNQF